MYDFHGTLADVTDALPLLRDGDYDGFYEGSLVSPAIESTVLSARHSHEAGYVNLLFTGMPDRYAEGLNQWLIRNNVPIDLIRMRTPEDKHMKDFIVKRRMYLEIVDLGYCVMRAWEDSPAVIDFWRRQAIPVVPVPRREEILVTRQVDNSPPSS